MKIQTATGLVALYMRLMNFKGWTSLWNVIYIYPGWEQTEWLIRHEKMHLAQMQRDGKMLFMLKYTYWLARYGYWNNPYEVEARSAENR